ncbi:MAG: DUF3828 domain-containing protein [Acidobacteria bacterium]|nr:DUF3828 domain-containing protein [Acidobacteriota bacterium]
MKRSVAFAAALLFVACATTAPPPPDTPDQVVDRFYKTYIAHRPGGLPEGKDLDRLRPMLSSRLQAAIESAGKYSAAYAKAHPGDKPPFVDGDYFTSVFEGPTSFQIAKTEPAADGSGGTVVVQFLSEGMSWNDTVIVTRENERFVIDDIAFSGAGEFNPPGRLLERLKARD